MMHSVELRVAAEVMLQALTEAKVELKTKA
jgi:hypothetical protein